MIIGVPREIKNNENRVALTPAGVHSLTLRGHNCVVEQGAGRGSSFPDAEYLAAGAALLPDAQAVFQTVALILKVKEPQPQEYPLLRAGQILFTYLHLAASRSLTDALLCSGITAIAYETV